MEVLEWKVKKIEWTANSLSEFPLGRDHLKDEEIIRNGKDTSCNSF